MGLIYTFQPILPHNYAKRSRSFHGAPFWGEGGTEQFCVIDTSRITQPVMACPEENVCLPLIREHQSYEQLIYENFWYFVTQTNLCNSGIISVSVHFWKEGNVN